MDWRLPYWITLILAGVSWVPLLFLPGEQNKNPASCVNLIFVETYGPVLEARLARAINTSKKIRAGSEKPNAKELLTVALIRPLRLFAEPIVLATSSLMALLYAIFYLFFEAYPIIFGGRIQIPIFVSDFSSPD